jgi:hypothetical protein
MNLQSSPDIIEVIEIKKNEMGEARRGEDGKGERCLHGFCGKT